MGTYHIFTYPEGVCDLPSDCIKTIRRMSAGSFVKGHVYYMEGNFFIDATNSKTSE